MNVQLITGEKNNVIIINDKHLMTKMLQLLKMQCSFHLSSFRVKQAGYLFRPIF